MSNRFILWLKAGVHAACLGPLAWLVFLFLQSAGGDPGALGPDPTATVTLYTGFGALRLLVISLAVTPLRRLIPRLGWLIRFRRMLGLYAFAWASLHLLVYLWLYSGWSWTAISSDILRRPYIWAGVTAWGLMVPLALTSTASSIRRLGGRGWAGLHRLVYLSAIAGVVHYWWIVKTGVLAPLRITVALAALLAARPVLSWWRSRSPRRAMPSAA